MKKHILNSKKTLADGINIRERHYEKYLGKLEDRILHPTDNEKPHIDIYQIAPTPKRLAWTLITGGMSDVRQNIPLNYKRTSGRTELLMYVAEPQDWMFGLLKELALMPFRDNNFVHWNHSCCLGDNRITKSSGITHALYMPPFFECERFADYLYINGGKVDPLWVVPITRPELELCQQENGLVAVMDGIMQTNRPRIFDIIG